MPTVAIEHVYFINNTSIIAVGSDSDHPDCDTLPRLTRLHSLQRCW